MKRYIIACALFAAASSAYAALFPAAPSVVNQFLVTEPYYAEKVPPSGQYGYSDTTAKTPATFNYNFNNGNRPGVGLMLGQSHIMSGCSNCGPHNPTNASACFNLNIYDGNQYLLTDPALGAAVDGGTQLTWAQLQSGVAATTWGSWFGYFCDALVNAKRFTALSLITPAQGGAFITDWSRGFYWNRARAGIMWARANKIPISFVMWMQGQADSAAIDPFYNAFITTQQYQNELVIMQQNVTAMVPNDPPWIIVRDTCPYITNQPCTGPSTFPNALVVDAAQTGIIDNHKFFQPSGASVLNIAFAGNYGPDNLHYTDAGQAAVGATLANAIINCNCGIP